MTMPSIPSFLKRAKGESKGFTKPRAPRRRKLKLPPIPKSWKDAEKVRVRAYTGWPNSDRKWFPCGYRSVLVKRPKTSRGKVVRVREFPCYNTKLYTVNREIFERSVIKEN
jgi:hypothetical protein